MYPTKEAVLNANHEQLARWYRHLPSPSKESQVEIINLISKRFKEMGGFNPALSKKIGF